MNNTQLNTYSTHAIFYPDEYIQSLETRIKNLEEYIETFKLNKEDLEKELKALLQGDE